ncbi:MAG: hypothetical protein JOS17DRAFT_88178 [Linnemannia elongata]|nr:MAG: hypothetical protein JOS17DRAFT_88178 [Linnemannia elongata]
MKKMRYKLPSLSKTLVFVVLLLASLPLGLLLHSTSAYTTVTYNDAETYPGCNPFPCPSPPYPPDNTCTNITARFTDPLTNITSTTTETYMLTYNLPEPYNVTACQNIMPFGRRDLFGCNSIGCSESGMYSTLVFCDLYIHEDCVSKSGVAEGEAWRDWGDESLSFCSPCGIAFKPVPLGIWEEKDMHMAEVVVENHDVLEVVL